MQAAFTGECVKIYIYITPGLNTDLLLQRWHTHIICDKCTFFQFILTDVSKGHDNGLKVGLLSAQQVRNTVENIPIFH